jgi:hypothetical protein
MKRTVITYNIVLTLFFLIWILIPSLNDIFYFSREPSFSKTENRNLARKPIFNINLLDPYPVAYETYFKDHFVFRPQAIGIHSWISFYLFRRSPIPNQVDIGKDGWYFNSSTDKLIYQGKRFMTEDSIHRIVSELHKRTLYYRGKGIHFYVCFAPMAQEIYPEYLPNNYFRNPGGTQTDKVITAIRKDPVISFIDLKSALLKAKKFGRLYQKTDNHWNCYGGYFAYCAIMERIKKDFPEQKILTAPDVIFKHHIRPAGSLANMIGFADVLKEDDYYPVFKNQKAVAGKKAGYPPPYWFGYKDEYEVVWVNPDKNLPKLFVIRDSFFNFPMLYLRENFSKTTVIWDAWMFGPNKSLIENEKPDVVLLMVVEPLIDKILISPID